jgi:hypothetical protein
MAQVTRLLDQPGNPEVHAFPASVVRSDDPGVALTPGTRPALVVFHDDASRASDLQAARLLPMIVRLRDGIDFVAVDRTRGAPASHGAQELARRYLDHVPTVVVLDAQRRTRFLRADAVDARAVEQALVAARRPPEDATAPAGPSAPAGEAPTPGPGQAPTPADGATPAAPPADEDPARHAPTFSAPLEKQARDYAQRLRAAPGDASLAGYPPSLVTRASPDLVMAPGTRPCVVLFKDDASKASDLQAADFLPVLARARGDVDVVVIDVGPKARWTPSEKKVVRTYYNFYVPTTVVLAPNRAPVKSWYSRVDAASLSAALQQAGGR